MFKFDEKICSLGVFFLEKLKKVILIRMMFKIRILFFDFLVNIILRVYFIDLCGWVRWEFCSCFCEMWLRVCVMWMWWYWWLVEKWFNNVMEFYLFWDFILVIKKVFYLKFLYVKLYISCFELDICCFVIEIFLKMRNCLKCEFCDFERVFLIGFFVMVV